MGVDRQDLAEPRRSKTGESNVVVECRKGATVVTAAALALSAHGIGNGPLARWPAGTGAMLPRWAA